MTAIPGGNIPAAIGGTSLLLLPTLLCTGLGFALLCEHALADKVRRNDGARQVFPTGAQLAETAFDFGCELLENRICGSLRLERSVVSLIHKLIREHCVLSLIAVEGFRNDGFGALVRRHERVAVGTLRRSLDSSHRRRRVSAKLVKLACKTGVFFGDEARTLAQGADLPITTGRLPDRRFFTACTARIQIIVAVLVIIAFRFADWVNDNLVIVQIDFNTLVAIIRGIAGRRGIWRRKPCNGRQQVFFEQVHEVPPAVAYGHPVG